MKTIKIIDLLNKIANGEEVPNSVRFDSEIWDKVNRKSGISYTSDYKDLFVCFFRQNFTLNDEVEIIEKEKKIPEKLLGEPRHIYNENELYIVDKVNEIIDYLESKEKGE